MLAGLDEPVVRYLTHAIAEGTPLAPGVRLRMSGRIRVRLWLPFTADQECDGRSFTWRARVGRGSFTPLVVTDRFADGAGSMDGRLLGRVPLFHADDPDTGRSAAGRAALEAILAPVGLLPAPASPGAPRTTTRSWRRSRSRPRGPRCASGSTDGARCAA